MARHRMLNNPANPNGIRVPFTEAEEAQADADKAAQVIRKQAEADAAAQQATDKASAVSKLGALGLTSSEIDTLKQ